MVLNLLTGRFRTIENLTLSSSKEQELTTLLAEKLKETYRNLKELKGGDVVAAYIINSMLEPLPKELTLRKKRK